MRASREDSGSRRRRSEARAAAGLALAGLVFGGVASVALRGGTEILNPAEAIAAEPAKDAPATPASATPAPATAAPAKAAPAPASAAPAKTPPAKTPPAAATTAVPVKPAAAAPATPAKVAPAPSAARPVPAAAKPAAPSVTPAKPASSPAVTPVTKAGSAPSVATAPVKGAALPARAGTASGGTVARVPVPASPVKPAPVQAAAQLDEHVTYQYNALGRRDPFTPILGGEFIGVDVGGDAPADIGGIKVVGIMWGTADKFALAEDGRGNSLVLRAGDKVMNGVVEAVQREAVVVKLTVDGQTQSVAIPLTRKGDQNASR